MVAHLIFAAVITLAILFNVGYPIVRYVGRDRRDD